MRAQQLEREVGQLLGELSNEQSKLEDVNQQNTELRAELEQFRGNLTAFDDPKKVCLRSALNSVMEKLREKRHFGQMSHSQAARLQCRSAERRATSHIPNRPQKCSPVSSAVSSAVALQ